MSLAEEKKPAGEQGGFWSYLKSKELEYYPTGGLRWWLLMMVVFLFTVEELNMMKIGNVLVFIFADFKVGLPEWGVYGTVSALVSAIGAFYLSILADKYGRRGVIIWSVLGYLVVSVATAMSTSFLMVGSLYVLGSVIVAGMTPAVTAAMRDLSPQTGRGLAFSLLGVAYTAGALLSNFSAAITIPVWPGWRPQFWLSAVVAAIAVVIGAVFYRDISARVRGQIAHDQSEAMKAAASSLGFATMEEALEDGKRVYKDWRLWVLGISMFWWAIAYMGVAVFVPTMLVQHHGVKPETASLLSSWFWVTFTASVFVSGIISDKLRTRKPIMAFGGISTGIAFLALAAMPKGTSETALGTATALMGIFSGFIYPAYMAMLSENAEEISPFGVARTFGFTAIVSYVGIVVLNAGVPMVVTTWGWPTFIGISGIGCFMIAVFAAFGRGPWGIPKQEVTHGTAAD